MRDHEARRDALAGRAGSWPARGPYNSSGARSSLRYSYLTAPGPARGARARDSSAASRAVLELLCADLDLAVTMALLSVVWLWSVAASRLARTSAELGAPTAPAAASDAEALWCKLAPAKAPPLVGFGNELIFQSTNDTGLNEMVAASGSQLQRYPGGTPSGFWSWQKGLEIPPMPGPSGRHDSSIPPDRPCTAAQWAEYLTTTKQRTIVVPNILTSNLTFEMQGLKAMAAAGVNVEMVRAPATICMALCDKCELSRATLNAPGL